MHMKFLTILGGTNTEKKFFNCKKAWKNLSDAGCALATPMLMVSIRNLEILMVLSVEICAFNHYPALTTTFGIVLVLVSIHYCI